MADVLVRLNVQSEEYENKLKNATASLQQMEKEVRRTGATFAYADKEEVEFIKSLGSMETHATNASGKVKEMTQAIAEMSLVYQRMTEEEKKSPTGKALAESIEQAKSRLGEYKSALAEAGGEMQKTGGFVDTLADGLSQLGPIGQVAGRLIKGAFGPIGIVIAAVVGFVQQLVSAFKRNEDAMASVNRAAAPFKAIWQGIQQLFDKLASSLATVIEKASQGLQSMFDKLTEWMGKLSNTKIGQKLGLDTLYQQLLQVKNAQDELTKSNERIANSERELQNLRRSTKTANTNRTEQVSELRAKASDRSSYSADERVQFLEKAMELEKKNLEANITLRQKEYDLIKLKNSLTQSGTEDLNAENDALNAITEARIEYNNQMRAMQRQLQAAKSEAGKASEQPTDTSKVKDATAIWEEYQRKIAETKARLEEFRAMIADANLSDDQRSWAEGMADKYQAELDKMTGATEEAAQKISKSLENIPTEFDIIREELGKMSSGIGAISTIGNAFNELKGIGEDLADAFSGEMSAWDALMTVFNSGIGILDTVVSVMEAINLLTELSTTLSKKKAATKAAEATTVASAAGTEAAAEGAAAVASGAAAGANAAEASSAAGKAVSWIPIVGPILAVAAIAAVLGSTLAAISQAKSSGKGFAAGGIVPGNSFSGDNVRGITPSGEVFGLNSGEVVLNHAQTNNLASQLQGGNQGGQITGTVTGANIYLALANFAKQNNKLAGSTTGGLVLKIE